MVYNIPEKLKEENQLEVVVKFFIRDLVSFGICMAVFSFLSGLITNETLKLIYWVFAFIFSVYLSKSAKDSNPGVPRKQRWEAIQMMFMKDPATYYSLNMIREEDLMDDTGDEGDNESKETK